MGPARAEGVPGVEHTQLPWVARGPAISLPVRAERSVRVRVRGPPSPRRSAQLMHWPPLYRLAVERHLGALRRHVYDLSSVPPVDPHTPRSILRRTTALGRPVRSDTMSTSPA